jgi:hypothetical protein
MGLDLVYSCGQVERSVRFTDAEWTCIDRLRAVAQAPIDTLFNVPDFGQPVAVVAEELVEAAGAVLQLLRDRPDLQPATYQMRMEHFPNSAQPDGEWQGGAVSGLRLPGDADHFYFIRVGPDRCELEKMAVGPDGRGVIVGREDMRGRDHVQTETVGRVDLRRRPSGASLRKKLAELQAFFAGLVGRQVSKVLC